MSNAVAVKDDDGNYHVYTNMADESVIDRDPADLVYGDTIGDIQAALEELHPAIKGFTQFSSDQSRGVVRRHKPPLLKVECVSVLFDAVSKHGITAFGLAGGADLSSLTLHLDEAGIEWYHTNVNQYGFNIVLESGLCIERSSRLGYSGYCNVCIDAAAFKRAKSNFKRRETLRKGRAKGIKPMKLTSSVPTGYMHRLDNCIWSYMCENPISRLFCGGVRGPYWGWAEQVHLTMDYIMTMYYMGFADDVHVNPVYRKVMGDIQPYVKLLLTYDKPTANKCLRNNFGTVLRKELRETLGVRIRLPNRKKGG